MKVFFMVLGFALGVVATILIAPNLSNSSRSYSSHTRQAASSGGVEVSDVAVSQLGTLLDETRYTWKATLKNTSSRPARFTATLMMQDRNNFVVETDINPGVQLAPGEERVVSKESIMKTALISRAEKYSVTTDFR